MPAEGAQQNKEMNIEETNAIAPKRPIAPDVCPECALRTKSIQTDSATNSIIRRFSDSPYDVNQLQNTPIHY